MSDRQSFRLTMLSPFPSLAQRNLRLQSVPHSYAMLPRLRQRETSDTGVFCLNVSRFSIPFSL